MTSPLRTSIWKDLMNTLLHRSKRRSQFAASGLDGGAQDATSARRNKNERCDLTGTVRSTIACVALLLIATAAGAQNSERPRGSLLLGPQVGFFKSQDADVARTMWGAALRLKISDALGVEGSLNYREEEYQNGAVTVKSWPVMVTGLLYPLPMIYGAMGIGWYNSSIDFKTAPDVLIASETHQDFGWHFGGGVEVPLGTTATVVGDVRYVFLNYEFQNLPGSSGVTSNFYVIDIGLLFAL